MTGSNKPLAKAIKKNSSKAAKQDLQELGSSRKKYHVINEDVRKQIIDKLVKDSAKIKDVADEFGLKLSTCKAILQVYQKEGRIGKKATRDRKTKIVSTVILARIDPMNPTQSTVTPFINIAETTTASQRCDDNAHSELVKEAFKNAYDHVKSIISEKSSPIFTEQKQTQECYQKATTLNSIVFSEKLPASVKKELQLAFTEAQRNAISSLLESNPIHQIASPIKSSIQIDQISTSIKEKPEIISFSPKKQQSKQANENDKTRQNERIQEFNQALKPLQNIGEFNKEPIKQEPVEQQQQPQQQHQQQQQDYALNQTRLGDENQVFNTHQQYHPQYFYQQHSGYGIQRQSFSLKNEDMNFHNNNISFNETAPYSLNSPNLSSTTTHVPLTANFLSPQTFQASQQHTSYSQYPGYQYSHQATTASTTTTATNSAPNKQQQYFTYGGPDDRNRIQQDYYEAQHIPQFESISKTSSIPRY